MMPKTIYKAGEQASGDPFEFIMSSPIVDRYGDIVEQDWNLKWFKKNPIALFSHASSNPIGIWEKVRVENDRLVGRLKLAARGTSEFIDTLWALVEQRILRAVSVGFISHDGEPIDKDKPFGGWKLSGNELMECSLVSVPANPEALSFAKSLDTAGRKRLFAEPGERKEVFTLSAASQLGHQKSQVSDIRKPQRVEGTAMSLTKKIEGKQSELTDLRNQLSALTEELGDDITDEQTTQLEELTAQIDKSQSDLDSLTRAEAALAVRATSKKSAREEVDEGAAVAIHARSNKPKGHRALAVISSIIKGYHDRSSPISIAEEHYKDEPELAMLVRAAVAPATVTSTTWAAPLVGETWGEFIDLIRDISVYPRIPAVRLNFDSNGTIHLPRNTGRGSLAGGFVGEGAPIPVKAGAFDTVDLSPKKMAVITAFTREIAEHSAPAIEGILRQQILDDTAEALDGAVLDNVARTAVRPAGFQNTAETGATNIVASAGATVANIVADTEGALGRMMAARAGTGGVWIMNPLRVLGLRNKQDAASGQFVFRSEIAGGTFQGYPLIVSQNVPVGVVVFVTNGSLAIASDYSPRIAVSEQAALHMENTAPAEIVDGTGAAAQPVRSLFQTDSIALRMTVGMDWRIIRAGGIQVLTGAAW